MIYDKGNGLIKGGRESFHVEGERLNRVLDSGFPPVERD